jgi:hypothetical protein
MSKYVQISDEIDQLKPMANLVMDTVPYQNRTGFESVKNQAISRIAQLEEDFAKLVKDNAVYVFLEGNPQLISDFANEAHEQFDALTIDASAWDQKVGGGWWKANGEKSGTIDTVHTIQLLDELRHTMVDLKMTEVETPNVPRNISLNSEKECVDTVKEITTVQCGADFRFALLQHEAVKSARDNRWAGDTGQPILFTVTNSSAAERHAISLLTPRSFSVTVTKFSEKGVESVLTGIAKKLKSTK